MAVASRRAKSTRRVKEWGRWPGALTSTGKYGSTGRRAGNATAKKFLKYSRSPKGSEGRLRAAHMLKRTRPISNTSMSFHHKGKATVL